MQLQPQNRYESVKDLSNDVERHLADEPVTVCREPVTVRCRRWIKKNQSLATGLAPGVVVCNRGLDCGRDRVQQCTKTRSRSSRRNS